MKDYAKLANDCRKKVLTMIFEAQTSHVASNFSCIDVATVLYENLKKGDEVVWSAGWKAATIYYFLAKQGKIPVEDLDKFAKEENGKIQYLGLAETTTLGVWCNGGSVGHGLPVAVGMALGKKLKGEKGTIYAILSDGELNEGSVWEAAQFAAHHKLCNLVAIIDKNGWQALGKTDDVINLDICRIFDGFGWSTYRIDGHRHFEFERELSHPFWGMPKALVCDTIKGKGVSFMENHLTYHYKHVSEEDYKKAMEELNA